MGLDTVELVLEVEEAFSIKLPDEEASNINTVGELYDCVLSKTQLNRKGAVCLSAKTFYSLRKAAESLGAPKRMRPRDATNPILGATSRRERWKALGDRSGLKLPHLHRPQWLKRMLTISVGLIALVASIYANILTHSQLYSFATFFVFAFLIGWLAYRFTESMAVELDARSQSMWGLTESVLAINFENLATANQGATDQDIWIAIKQIISEQLGVEPEKVKPESRFVEDLGAD